MLPFDASAFAPGRVEILGNHTDYNDGFVLSAALDLGTTAAGRRLDEGVLRFSSDAMDGSVDVAIEDGVPLTKRSGDDAWANYLLGVFEQFRASGIAVGGVEVDLRTTLPLGAGLSSSAALTVSFATLLVTLFGAGPEGMALARLCRRVEQQFIKRHNEDYPNIDIVASELLQDKIISRIEDRELDLALTYDMSLEGRPIKKQVLDRLKPFILLSVDHPLAARSSIRLAELAQEPFVMFDGPSSRDYFNSLLAVHGIDPQISFNSRSIESVRCAVASGLGFSLSIMTPRYRETYDGGRIVYVPIAGDVDPMSVVLIRREEKSPSKLIDNFVDTCKAHFYETIQQE